MNKGIGISAPVGALIGYFAWSPEMAGMPWMSLAMLLLLPVSWVKSISRFAAFLLFVAYYATFSRDVPDAYANFFPGESLWIGYGVWLLDAGILALPWAITHTKSWTAGSLATRYLIALVVTLLPPVGIINWGHPLLAAGAVYPGTGLAGLLAAALLGYLAALAATGNKQGRKGVMAMVALGVAANVAYATPPPPSGWVGISTAMGRYPEKDFRRNFEWQQELIRIADSATGSWIRVMVFPEEVAGAWKPSKDYWWKDTAERSKLADMTILMGVDLQEPGGFRDAVKALGSESGTVLSARVPMPVGNWKFWRAGQPDSAIPDLLGSGRRVIAGKTAVFSICYEDFLLWPHLESMIGRPDVLVSMANNWSVRGLAAEWHQELSIQAQARLIGAPLVRASNR